MSVTVVRYRTRPEAAEENQALPAFRRIRP